MKTSNMKNIVVLKNLPSNLVEEAIIILKSNKDAKKLQYIDNNAKLGHKEKSQTNDYVIKEAEAVISNYIYEIENKKKNVSNSLNIDKKYKKLKKYSIVVTIFLFFCVLKFFA